MQFGNGKRLVITNESPYTGWLGRFTFCLLHSWDSFALGFFPRYFFLPNAAGTIANGYKDVRSSGSSSSWWRDAPQEFRMTNWPGYGTTVIIAFSPRLTDSFAAILRLSWDLTSESERKKKPNKNKTKEAVFLLIHDCYLTITLCRCSFTSFLRERVHSEGCWTGKEKEKEREREGGRERERERERERKER